MNNESLKDFKRKFKEYIQSQFIDDVIYFSMVLGILGIAIYAAYDSFFK